MKNLFFVSVAFSIFSGTSLSANAQRVFNFSNSSTSVTSNFSDAELAPVSNAVPVKLKASEAEIGQALQIAAKEAKMAAGNKMLLVTENCKAIHFKFAQILNREVETLTNTRLFQFINEWWGTRYRYGGTTKKGIDCSAFTGLLMSTVYALPLPRTAREQYAVCEKLNEEDLMEGDLVFFNTRGGISHVGMYLGDGYFVHSGSSTGVTISNLHEAYWAKHFIKGGRVNENELPAPAEEETASNAICTN